jgi:hypothetical protein
MDKKTSQNDSTPTPPYDTRRLIVKGVRRKEPDWDTYIAVLLAHAMHKVGADEDLQGVDDD